MKRLTVKQLHERLGTLIEQGYGEQEIIIRLTEKVSDKRYRKGYRTVDYFGSVSFGLSGKLSVSDRIGTELKGRLFNRIDY